MAARGWVEQAWGRTPPAPALRALLSLAEAGYRTGRAAHRALYRTGLRGRVTLPACVVSIGNLAVGGVGKTPFAAWLAQRLVEGGARVMVLGRGYRRAAGERLNDEGEWLEREVPGALVVQAPDRARAALARLAASPCDVVLLDDGFQHERLARDLDVVLLDGEDPFSNGRCLPRGALREPPAALARADWIVATRCEHLEAGALDRLRRDASRHAPRARFGAVRFVVSRLRDGPRSLPADALRDATVVLCTGVGQPRAVRRTLAQLGARIAGEQLHPDHHAFTRDDLARAQALAAGAGARLVVTAKDAVKLDRFAAGTTPGYLVLEQELEWLEGEEALLSDLEARRRARVAALSPSSTSS